MLVVNRFFQSCLVPSDFFFPNIFTLFVFPIFRPDEPYFRHVVQTKFLIQYNPVWSAAMYTPTLTSIIGEEPIKCSTHS
jgi:hypothetical protein